MIVVKELSKTYESGSCCVQAVRGVSFTVDKGDFVAIIGPSGSGKSTLMHMLGCLDAASGGQYQLDGEDVTRLSRDGLSRVRSRKIGFVFQQFNLLPRLTALENVALPLAYMGISLHERNARAMQALDSVGLYPRAHHLPSEMSGGQQQRVAIARALITRPPLVLADEPTGNLDSVSGSDIMRLLTRLGEDGCTVVLITHDAGVAGLARRQLVMCDGRMEG